MKNEIVLVTGVTGSIGAATAEAFARAGATVVVSGRDGARTAAAAERLRQVSGNARVEPLVADLGRLDSVRQAAAELRRRHDRLHVLVNNAAVFKRRRTQVGDGLEEMFATNHLGPFLLTHLLLEPLKASGGARVLNVTAPSVTKLAFDDLQGERKFSALHAFGASKMANLLFTYALARKLEGTGVTVNAFHPGLVKSGLLKEAAAPVRFLVNLASKAPDAVARALVHLGTSPALATTTGRFFKLEQEIRSVPYSHDPQVQQRLWDESVRLTGLAA